METIAKIHVMMDEGERVSGEIQFQSTDEPYIVLRVGNVAICTRTGQAEARADLVLLEEALREALEELDACDYV